MSGLPQRSSRLEHPNKSKYFEEIVSLITNPSSNTNSDILIVNTSLFLRWLPSTAWFCLDCLWSVIYNLSRLYHLVTFLIAVIKYPNKMDNIFKGKYLFWFTVEKYSIPWQGNQDSGSLKLRAMLYSQSGSRERWMLVFVLSIKSRTQDQGQIPPTFSVDLSTSVNPAHIFPYRRAQRLDNPSKVCP